MIIIIVISVAVIIVINVIIIIKRSQERAKLQKSTLSKLVQEISCINVFAVSGKKNPQ